ncbi:hypothetical protein [Frankia sp. Cppng1_Ct_nod]|uniref:hypothetical protein n=1 Tax=Frankia sp. Cppng1_Ct_nod TaxID=2897162 RepID=UPI00104193A9|nr:hypothetical protein [Frankia sp. Cppng1_Ct_nod]
MLASIPGQVAVWAVSLIGMAVAVAEHARFRADLAGPVPLGVLVVVMVVSLATTAVHEIAHGLSLTRAGGRVRRMGVMLLYGSPSLFCDVSQSWRQPRRRRVAVALAGVRVHVFAAATAVLVASALPSGSGHQVLSLVAAADILMAVINLCPFVKFDGYVALVGWLDRPHLRPKSMALVHEFVQRWVFGGPREPRGWAPTGLSTPLPPIWALFGIACMLTAPTLVAAAFSSYEPLLLALLGPVGGVLVLFLLVYTLSSPLTALLKLERAAAVKGVSRMRRLAGGFGVSLAVAVILSTVQVPLNVTTPYTHDTRGIALVLPEGARPVSGLPVELKRSGIVLHPRLGLASVCGDAHRESVQADAGSPVRISEGQARLVDRTVVALCLSSGSADPDGLASVSTGRLPFGTWLRRVYVDPAWHRLS